MPDLPSASSQTVPPEEPEGRPGLEGRPGPPEPDEPQQTQEPQQPHEPRQPGDEAAPAAQSRETWRAPVTAGVKPVLGAAVGILVAAVFFPVWIAVPVAVLLGVWALGLAARRPAVVLDPGRGLVTVTLGVLSRRIRLADVSVVQIERAKVTFGQADGTAVSVHAWRRGRLDAWLRMPDVAGDLAHAVSKAASVARAPDKPATASLVPPGERRGDGGGAKIRSGKNLPLTVVTVAGLIEVAAVFFVRVSWPSPVMTVLGALVALGLGFAGVFSLVFALWTYLTGRPGAARARG